MHTASRLFEIFTAHWTSAILASAVELGVFDALASGAFTARELSQKLGVPERSLQALLDGLVVSDLINLTDEVRYENTATASTYLVKGKTEYLGAFARILTGGGDGGVRQWSMLAGALRSGKPAAVETIVDPDNPFWPDLVRALTPLSREVALIAARLLNLEDGRALSILDIGGGAGAYAQAWLPLNPKARVTQVDWAAVNALAREGVAARGSADRFITLDGDFHEVSFGAAEHDVVVLSNICHHESPAGNVQLLERIKAALVPGGKVVISEFVLNDDRKGPAFAARFGVGMVLQTPEGASYRECDYQDFLAQAGFERAQVDRSHPLSTLMIAAPRG